MSDIRGSVKKKIGNGRRGTSGEKDRKFEIHTYIEQSNSRTKRSSTVGIEKNIKSLRVSKENFIKKDQLSIPLNFNQERKS